MGNSNEESKFQIFNFFIVALLIDPTTNFLTVITLTFAISHLFVVFFSSQLKFTGKSANSKNDFFQSIMKTLSQHGPKYCISYIFHFNQR